MAKQGSGRRKGLLIARLISSSLLLISLVSLSTTTRAETSAPFRVPCRKIIDNGPDKDRIVLLIAGEGYTKDQSQLFKGDIDRLITQGILGHDFFKDNFRAFNVYVTENWSNASGASTGKGPKKDTAFNITFNDNAWGSYFGKWYDDKKCMQQLSMVEASTPARPDHIILIVNTGGQGHGGETLGNYVSLVSNGDPWWVLQHEMGHSIGHLLDEYTADNNPTYSGPDYEVANSATKADRYNVPWSHWVDPSTPVPTPFWITPKNGIGIYVGGATYAKGTYRPSLRCRMDNSEDPFCQVCKDYMTFVLNQHNPDPNNPYARMTKSIRDVTGGDLSHFDPIADKAYIEKTIPFTIHKDPLLLPMEPKPLPFLTPPSFNFPNFFIAQTYDKNGTKETKQIPNPFLLRSFPAKGKKTEFNKVIDQVNLGFRLPVSYDPAKEGFGVRLYKLNPNAHSNNIATLQGLKDKPVVERVSARSNVGASPAPELPSEPHVTVEPVIDQQALEQLKAESKVTLVIDLPAK